ncbi:MAG TPA: ABC transporter permease subunit [Methylomirabilota bacterium]|jgi:putative spermidine/putrescine transport system permease protein|nr:ABC transporter permease subunit [Methylomirabilota bacterium]
MAAWLGRAVSMLVVGAFALALLAPLGGTLLFALATRWVVTVLPEGWTLDAVATTLGHPRFTETLARSLGLAAAAVALDALLVVPALTALMLARPRWQVVFDVATVVPFALPGVVVALGLVRFYGWAWPDALHTPWLLAAAHAAGGLPIMYWAVAANLRAIGVRRLYEAGMLLGARPRQLLLRVVVPNVLPGLAAGGAFVFAFSFTDFAYANLLVGGGWPTFPVWQATMMLLDGHVMAVLSLLSFAVLWLTTHVMARWAQRRQLWLAGRAL